MIKKIALWILFKGGETDMAAVLLTSQIIRGKITFDKVPNTLKEMVKTNLEEEGLGHLAQ